LQVPASYSGDVQALVVPSEASEPAPVADESGGGVEVSDALDASVADEASVEASPSVVEDWELQATRPCAAMPVTRAEKAREWYVGMGDPRGSWLHIRCRKQP
jgi:hypothetical protein